MSALSLLTKSSICSLLGTRSAKNFGLSEEEFGHLQTALKDGDQKLYERIFLTHFEACVAYLKTKDGAEHEEAYDITMETLLRFRDLLVTDKIGYGNLRYLFTRMARQRLQRSRQRQGIFTKLSDATAELPVEEDVFTSEEFELLTRAFKSLSKDCRDLLKAFYHQRCTLKDLAKEENLSAPALRKRKSRCVATLRQYFYHIS
jgi:RNA polymerase sigma factor (sigma-70 family)